MKKLIPNLFLIGLTFFSIQTESFASELVGLIGIIRENQSTSSLARTSVEIKSSGNTDCFVANNKYYAFENAHTGIGKNWTELLTIAKQSGKQVRVRGTGTCDIFGVEKVEFIDML